MGAKGEEQHVAYKNIKPYKSGKTEYETEDEDDICDDINSLYI